MSKAVYRNPIQPDKITLRDPYILQHPNGYYLYGTTRNPWDTTGDGFDAWFSRDLSRWAFSGQVYERPDHLTWNTYQFRAPEVYERNGRYYMFYTAKSDDTRHAIGVAMSNSPLGPFLDLHASAITPTDMDCKDPHLFTDTGGTHWLFFINEWPDGGDCAVFVQRLSGDMTRTIGQPVQIITAADASWSKPIEHDGQMGRLLEAPCLMAHQNRFYLMLSAMDEQGYCTGYFTATQLEGPWADQGTVIRHDGGHNCVFTGPNGKTLYTAYHSPNGPTNSEKLCIDELRFLDDGKLFIDESRDQDRYIELL